MRAKGAPRPRGPDEDATARERKRFTGRAQGVSGKARISVQVIQPSRVSSEPLAGSVMSVTQPSRLPAHWAYVPTDEERAIGLMVAKPSEVLKG